MPPTEDGLQSLYTIKADLSAEWLDIEIEPPENVGVRVCIAGQAPWEIREPRDAE